MYSVIATLNHHNFVFVAATRGRAMVATANGVLVILKHFERAYSKGHESRSSVNENDGAVHDAISQNTAVCTSGAHWRKSALQPSRQTGIGLKPQRLWTACFTAWRCLRTASLIPND